MSLHQPISQITRPQRKRETFIFETGRRPIHHRLHSDKVWRGCDRKLPTGTEARSFRTTVPIPSAAMLDLESGQWSPQLNPSPEPLLTGTFVCYTATSPELYLVDRAGCSNRRQVGGNPCRHPPTTQLAEYPHGSVVLFARPNLVVWRGFLYGNDVRGDMVSTGWMWRPEMR